MSLEKTIMKDARGFISVLDKEKGLLENEFRPKEKITSPFNQLHQYGDKIIINTNNGLVCYSLDGEKLWSYGEVNNRYLPVNLTYSDKGFYIVNSSASLRLSGDARDLWASHIDFSGKVIWQRQLAERTNNQRGGILKNAREIVVPYMSEDNNRDKGVYILEKDGGKTEKKILIPDMDGCNVALIGNKLIYNNVKEDKRTIRILNIDSESLEPEIQVNNDNMKELLGNQIGCSSLGNKVYYSGPDYLRVVDIENGQHLDNSMLPNYGFRILGDIILIDRAMNPMTKHSFNKLKPHQLETYSQDGKKLWEHLFTGEKHNYFFTDGKDSVYLAEDNGLTSRDIGKNTNWKTICESPVLSIAITI